MKRATCQILDYCVFKSISIHALVKRATSTCILVCTLYLHFNPRPREEGDELFPREHLLRFYFNPRPREEGDAVFITIIVDIVSISIHALVKRATNLFNQLFDRELISIHALVKRATKSLLGDMLP